jgi:hypothetical protein
VVRRVFRRGSTSVADPYADNENRLLRTDER